MIISLSLRQVADWSLTNFVPVQTMDVPMRVQPLQAIALWIAEMAVPSPVWQIAHMSRCLSFKKLQEWLAAISKFILHGGLSVKADCPAFTDYEDKEEIYGE